MTICDPLLVLYCLQLLTVYCRLLWEVIPVFGTAQLISRSGYICLLLTNNRSSIMGYVGTFLWGMQSSILAWGGCISICYRLDKYFLKIIYNEMIQTVQQQLSSFFCHPGNNFSTLFCRGSIVLQGNNILRPLCQG